MEEMKVKAIAPWFGGKRTLAPAIVKELGKHTQYFEPFCGSLAVLFAKEPSRQETAMDLHFDVTNLAQVLCNEQTAIELYQKLQFVLNDEAMLEEAQDFIDADPQLQDCVDRAFYYFIGSWMGRNGVSGLEREKFQMAVRWTDGGGSPSVRWASARESIPAFHRRMQNCVFLHRDAFNCIPKFKDSKGTAIYIDSPYRDEARSHGNYKHDFKSKPSSMFGDDDKVDCDDHQRLRDMLTEFKHSRIVASHYDCPRIRRLYEGWTFIEKTRQKNLHSQNGRGSRKLDAPEVLIVNGASYTE